jgi:predicted nuclease with RNAse H fold|tara:strand:+ start:3746 stop:4378 length:633 start_codon:yes stop_codon:yes gene_type:complete
VFLGIDLTTTEQKPTACALLDASGALASVDKLRTDDEMVALVREASPSIIAIDSPLGLPLGMDCLEENCDCQSVHEFKGRRGERELIDEGINLYLTTKRSIIKPMVYRAMSLAERFRALGAEVIEVYPFASKVRVFGRPIPPKNTREGREFLRRRLEEIIPGLAADERRLDHDCLDALIAAYTARLHAEGATDAMGFEEEVKIVVPSRPA